MMECKKSLYLKQDHCVREIRAYCRTNLKTRNQIRAVAIANWTFLADIHDFVYFAYDMCVQNDFVPIPMHLLVRSYPILNFF